MMADFNPKIAELTNRLTQPTASTSRHRDDDGSDSDDEDIFAQLEAEIENDSNPAVREQGLERMKRELEKLKSMREACHGQYTEVKDEKEVIRISANEARCVIHFYHSNFKRCEIMDKHLAKLAPKYFGTRFIRVFVENVPWLVEKLAIKVLPCVVCFADGVTKDRIIGFEELGNQDAFETAALEWRLKNAGVLVKEERGAPEIVYGAKPRVRQQIRGRGNDDSDFDIED